MTTLQVRIDEGLKRRSDELFSGLGLDTPTAVRMFLAAALEYEGFPFPLRRRRMAAESREAMEDAFLHRNLNGPYATADEAVKAMLAD